MTNLESHPIGGDDNSDEEIEHVKAEDFTIKVTQAPGYLCHIAATATFQLPPDKMFRQIITHPSNEKVFRHMDRCSYRKILQDNGDGTQKVEVAHEASWRFLLFKGKFTTRLIVDQDLLNRVMRFELKPGAHGIMKKFVGVWKVEPHPEDVGACITHLDQDLALGVYMPPPFDRILKGISCNQVKRIFEDVKEEARKINSGKPSLDPWEEVQLTEIGVEEEAPKEAP